MCAEYLFLWDLAFHLIGDDNPENQLEMLKLFLDNGQDVNAIDEYGASILIWFVAFLIEKEFGNEKGDVRKALRFSLQIK